MTEGRGRGCVEGDDGGEERGRGCVEGDDRGEERGRGCVETRERCALGRCVHWSSLYTCNMHYYKTLRYTVIY